jgi:hypothetical protein
MPFTASSFTTYADKPNERPRFYPRQIITADDLTLDQEYFREKLRLHNRLMHGWGVVCGATLEAMGTQKPWTIIVRPGHILGPYGDEVVIFKDLCFDLRTRCLEAVAMGENLCADTWQPPPAEAQTSPVACYVAVRYVQVQTRPVRIKAASCGCADDQCESSRWRDSYQICVLDTLPASHTVVAKATDEKTPPPCPLAPSDPWVVLGAVTLNTEGVVLEIAYNEVRRQLISFAESSWSPSEGPIKPNTPIT